MTHITAPPSKSLRTYAATQGNRITREYYNHLVGEINRGTVHKAVCRIEDRRFASVSYHLISIR